MTFSNNWNFITQVAAYPCAEPSPAIYAATFLPAIAPALIEFVSFGCRDILKFKLGIGAPCGRAAKAGWKKAVPPKVFDLAGKIMKFEHAFSTAGFWWMIADLTLDSAARWTSLAYKLNGCVLLAESANWSWEPLAPKVLFAGVPSSVAGRIVGYNGDPGHASIVSAICPEDWYVQINFEIDGHPLFTNGRPELTTWISSNAFGTFDFPGTRYDKGYPGQSLRGSGMHTGQNPRAAGSTEYIMMALADETSVITELHGHGSVSATPPLELYLDPLNCWKDLLAHTQENPAGRNRKGRQPNILDPFLAGIPPVPRRGPPGGKPRSKK